MLRIKGRTNALLLLQGSAKEGVRVRVLRDEVLQSLPLALSQLSQLYHAGERGEDQWQDMQNM